MKPLLAILIILVSGCVVPASEPAETFACSFNGQENTLYFQDNFTLGLTPPADSRVPGNGFNAAFTTNDMDEWLSAPAEENVWLVGQVKIEYWVKNNDAVAPIAIGGGADEGYHFFNQFGTNRGFIESYAIEYEPAQTDALIRYEQVLDLPEGDVLLERGDHMRLLLTSLVLDGGHEILYGGETPSNIVVFARCADEYSWQELSLQEASLAIPFNQGLLTGAVPAEAGVNYQDVPFTLAPETRRLTIEIAQTNTANEVKNDVDLSVQLNGEEVWSIGSPYTDEIGTRWYTNFNDMPPSDYIVRVNSYSGVDYNGKLYITQDA